MPPAPLRQEGRGERLRRAPPRGPRDGGRDRRAGRGCLRGKRGGFHGSRRGHPLQHLPPGGRGRAEVPPAPEADRRGRRRGARETATMIAHDPRNTALPKADSALPKADSSARRFIRILLADLPVKVICLAAAVILLFFHRVTTLTERFFSVPLNVSTPAGLAVASAFPRTVRITLRGAGDAIFPILEED